MRRYHVTTFGCQMNAHDSERIKGMLEELGLGEARTQSEADVLVFNTCTIREKPDTKFAAHLGQAKALKDADPEQVIAAIAECAAVCEHAHLPLQSGSTRILKRMRRTYGRERYLRLVDEMRAAIPDLALTTDVIVGFPGETDDDFRETTEVVEEVGFDGAFTFVYSPRHGTEAAAMPEQIPDDVKRERIERLIDVVQRIAHE